ncbi:unnamed protein product [Rhizophagus irregularis]|nr:unnamed protein product [Rhizophagus irregularis]
MILQVYVGNIHSDEWLKQFNTALKVDASFTIFKNNKRKLQILKYSKSENVGGDTAKFIDTSRKLCRDSEIVDLDEQKQYFIETLPFTCCYRKILEVFLGDTEPHRISFWKIKFDKDYATIDTFMTLQQRFDKFLGLRYNYNNSYKRRENYYKSPSQNTEVSCNVIKENDNNNKWRFDTNDFKLSRMFKIK